MIVVHVSSLVMVLGLVYLKYLKAMALKVLTWAPMALADQLCIPARCTAVVANDQRVEEGLTFIHMDGPKYKFAVRETRWGVVLKSLERATVWS